MMRKILTITLSLIMILSLAVPAYAVGNKVDCKLSPVYMCFGDSISAGCKAAGLDAELQPEYSNFVQNALTGDEGNFVVPYSFVSIFNDALGANPNSKNGAFPGLRAKDYCLIFDLLGTAKADSKWTLLKDYKNDTWGSAIISGYINHLLSDETKKAYVDATKKADVITVELGGNDITTFICNGIYGTTVTSVNADKTIVAETSEGNLLQLIKSLKDVGTVSSSSISALTTLNSNILLLMDPSKRNEALGKICSAMKTLQEDKATYDKFLKLFNDSFVKAGVEYRKYWTMLLSKIRTLNPNAIMIVTTIPNPINGIDNIGDVVGSLVGTGGLTQLPIEKIVQAFVNDMNAYIYNRASKYNYKVADISDVVLNSTYEETINGKVESIKYSFHPNPKEQQKLANAVLKQYKRAAAERTVKVVKKASKIIKAPKESICLHIRTIVKNKVPATYFTAGFTGTRVCLSCGEVVSMGQIIPRKTMGLVEEALQKMGLVKLVTIIKRLI